MKKATFGAIFALLISALPALTAHAADESKVTHKLYSVNEPNSGDTALNKKVLLPLKLQLALKGLKASPSAPLYFMLTFGYQDIVNDPYVSHTFASYVKVTGPNAAQQEWNTISWLPATFANDLKICVFNTPAETCAPVEGHLYSVEESIDFAFRAKLSVASWGPVAITEALFNTALSRIETLKSGSFKYQANDTGLREKGIASNCVHAVSDLGGEFVPYGGPFNSGYGIWGVQGTKYVVNFYRLHGAAWSTEGFDPTQYTIWDPLYLNQLFK